MTFDLNEETTLAEYLVYWLVNYSNATIRNSTYDTYSDIIYRHVIPNIGDIPLCELSLSDLQDFFNEQREHGNLRNNGELSAKTLDNYKKMLSKALEKAIDLEYIDRNPIRRVELTRALPPQMAVLTREEEKLMLDHCFDEEFVEFGFAAFLADKFGMRNGEICALRWSDFDLRNMTVRVSHTACRIRIREANSDKQTIISIGDTKTQNSRRVLPFTEKTGRIILNEMNRRRRSGYYETHNASRDMRDYIFVSKTGGYSDTGTINDNFKRMLKALGIDNDEYHFHTLRHTFATRAAERHVNEKVISYLLGHANVQITLDRYTHVLPDTARNDMKLIHDD